MQVRVWTWERTLEGRVHLLTKSQPLVLLYIGTLLPPAMTAGRRIRCKHMHEAAAALLPKKEATKVPAVNNSAGGEARSASAIGCRSCGRTGLAHE